MPPHLRPLYVKKCGDCDKLATLELVNEYNAIINYYCQKHGPKRQEEAMKSFERKYVRGA